MVILVDDQDRPVGTASKLQAHVSPGMLHRAFSVVILDSSGRMLLQRRAACKPTFAGLLSNACCSHPLSNLPGEGGSASGEEALAGVMAAACRRVKYELGLDLAPSDLQFVTKITYASPSHCAEALARDLCENEIDYVLIHVMPDGSPLGDTNPDEVSEVLWVTREECQNREGKIWPQLTPWFRIILTEGNLWDLCARRKAPAASE